MTEDERILNAGERAGWETWAEEVLKTYGNGKERQFKNKRIGMTMLINRLVNKAEEKK